ncbi:hypothetical protein FMM05_18995 [Flavobacterium zepuense]|uniref:CarboxypepD_reg-like domain-containing protein n=1 Tax=Flavobacterium zepuense TaxID=2593302 RepID=A0A552UUY2_9FLAO|nr:hypothetical protein [Flavobacterium zepuense]TRW22041.1 hypothetical protein FMM05_18995 [Flavobacterium zepuense]
MSKLLHILLLLVSLPAISQERKALQGRVVSGDMAVPDVFVINKATAAETKTDALGNFNIQAKAGDVIVVYSAKTEVRQFAISDASFKEVPYVVSINLNAYELEEVVVEGSTINSVSLGIVPKDQKQYTPAEKKLFTAEDGTDALFNAISGRTKMLKKAAETEKKVSLIEYLNGMYTEEEVTTEFGIPADKVKAFMFYAADNKDLAETVKGNNESLVKLKLIDLSRQYLSVIKE